jgi:uncharacterized protein (DUF952 family)
MTGRDAHEGPEPRLFHLVHPAAWEAFEGSGAAELIPPSLASEGFAHLSFASQLAGTLAAHFGELDALWLCELELTDRSRLVLEPSRGGALFPHLYRPIARVEFARRWRLGRGPTGWELPSLGATPTEDRPAGATAEAAG